MSSIYTSNVQLGALPSAGTIYIMNVQLGSRSTGSEKDSGAITVTAEAGATVSGLTVGKYYSIEATGGPWDAGIPGAENMYTFAVSNDGGTNWSGAMGWSSASGAFLTHNPDWSSSLVAVDEYRAQMGWKATTTSIKIRVADSAGNFGDNAGSLSWSLRENLSIFTDGVRLG